MEPLPELQALASGWREPVWCVGGGIRDRLLGRPGADLDLALTDAVARAREFARRINGFFVLLDDDRRTARVVARRSRAQFDFTELQGDLETDLRRRDFTINAIACRLEEWSSANPAWIDPTGGLADLAAGRLRLVGPTSLTDDPVRCLRAFRFQATLGFTLDSATRAAVTAAAPAIVLAAAERLHQEWLPLLAGPAAAEALAGSAETGLLAILLPGLPADGPATVAALERLVETAGPAASEWWAVAEQRAWCRGAALVGPSLELGPVAAALALSRRERRWLEILRRPVGAVDTAGLARLTLTAGEAAVGVLLVATARGQVAPEALPAALARLTGEVLPRWRAKPWVGGGWLAEATGATPGPAFKAALEAARLAQLDGRARTAAEALAIAREVLQHGG